MIHQVIYVPGIGDHHTYGQKAAIQLWRLFGLKPHYFALGWATKEGYDKKQDRLLKLVDALHSKGSTVSLVGVSAGASAALNTYANSDKILKIICICGKINNPQTIGRKIYEINPDFKESLSRVNNSLGALNQTQISNIMSIHPREDQTVPVCDTIISGAMEKEVPGSSHATGIFFGITSGASSISKFIRSSNK